MVLIRKLFDSKGRIKIALWIFFIISLVVIFAFISKEFAEARDTDDIIALGDDVPEVIGGDLIILNNPGLVEKEKKSNLGMDREIGIYKDVSDGSWTDPDHKIILYKSHILFGVLNSSNIIVFVKNNNNWEEINHLEEYHDAIYYDKKIGRLSDIKIEIKG